MWRRRWITARPVVGLGNTGILREWDSAVTKGMGVQLGTPVRYHFTQQTAVTKKEGQQLVLRKRGRNWNVLPLLVGTLGISGGAATGSSSG